MSIQQRGAATLAILSQDGLGPVLGVNNAVNNLGTYENISSPFHPTWKARQPNFLNSFYHDAHWYSNYPNTTPDQLVVKVKRAETGKDNVVTIGFIGNKIYLKYPTDLQTVWPYGEDEPNPNGHTGELNLDDSSRYADKSLSNPATVGAPAFYPRWVDSDSFDLSDKTEGNGLSYKNDAFGLYGYGDGASWPTAQGASLWVECDNLKSYVTKMNAPNTLPWSQQVEEPMQCEKSEIKYTARWRIQHNTASCWSHGCKLDLVVFIERVSLDVLPTGYATDGWPTWDTQYGPLYGYLGMQCTPSGQSEFVEKKTFSVTFGENSFIDSTEFDIEPEKGYLTYVSDFWIENVHH